MANHLIQPIDSLVTLLRLEAGYVNNQGEAYEQTGKFIDFPRELGNKIRVDLDTSSVVKRFPNQNIACLVHERNNYSYYHWTYETLPKLIYLSKYRQEIKVDKIYFHCGFFGSPYQRQAIKMLGFNFWQLLDAKRIDSLMGKEIIVIKLNETLFAPSRELCATIKSAFLPTYVKTPFRRIYVTRNHVKTGRKVVNEFQLRELLKTYGFETIIPDRLNVASQAKLFNESKYIINPHGAGLANIVFCQPGTRIIELFNTLDQSTWNPLYSKIAQTCNLELIPLAPQEVINNVQFSQRRDFIVDLNAIKAIFKDWGLENP